MNQKQLKFTIRTKESKKIIAEQHVTFGSEEKPFPKEWKDNPYTQLGIHEHKQEFLNSVLTVDVSEDLTESNVEPMFTIEEIKNYILSKDSMGDILYFLSADNINKANEIDNNEDEIN
jgi:hypothetical protein